jgi:hypothetical protein
MTAVPCRTILLIVLLLCPETAAARSDEALQAAHAIDAFVRPLVERGDLFGQLLVYRAAGSWPSAIGGSRTAIREAR